MRDKLLPAEAEHKARPSPPTIRAMADALLAQHANLLDHVDATLVLFRTGWSIEDIEANGSAAITMSLMRRVHELRKRR